MLKTTVLGYSLDDGLTCVVKVEGTREELDRVREAHNNGRIWREIDKRLSELETRYKRSTPNVGRNNEYNA